MSKVKVTMELSLDLLDGFEKDLLDGSLFDALGGIDAESALTDVLDQAMIGDVDAITILDVKVGKVKA